MQQETTSKKRKTACDLFKICELLTVPKLTSGMLITAELEKAADPRVIQRPRKNQKPTLSATVSARAAVLKPLPMPVPKGGDQDRASGRQEIFFPESGLFENF